MVSVVVVRAQQLQTAALHPQQEVTVLLQALLALALLVLVVVVVVVAQILLLVAQAVVAQELESLEL
jgi:hypothetical protein